MMICARQWKQVLADSSLPEDIRLSLAENLHKQLFSQVQNTNALLLGKITNIAELTICFVILQ